MHTRHVKLNGKCFKRKKSKMHCVFEKKFDINLD